MGELTWGGGQVTTAAQVVLCPNPGPMTLDGTNTWVLCAPGGDQAVVIDPGPLDEAHLQAVLTRVAELGARVVLTLLTHNHFDHAESAHRWAELTGAPVRGAGLGAEFEDGEQLLVGELQIEVLLTPGHTSDSVCFIVPGEGLLLTGDTVLGRGTSIVAHPDGKLAPYLTSLERLAAVADGLTLGPGHGPTHNDAAAVIAQYRAHRSQRLEQVRVSLGAVPEGTDDVAQVIVEDVYAQVPRDVWPAAKATVQAQLDYLLGQA